jgi:hypothetical protein
MWQRSQYLTRNSGITLTSNVGNHYSINIRPHMLLTTKAMKMSARIIGNMFDTTSTCEVVQTETIRMTSKTANNNGFVISHVQFGWSDCPIEPENGVELFCPWGTKHWLGLRLDEWKICNSYWPSSCWEKSIWWGRTGMFILLRSESVYEERRPDVEHGCQYHDISFTSPFTSSCSTHFQDSCECCYNYTYINEACESVLPSVQYHYVSKSSLYGNKWGEMSVEDRGELCNPHHIPSRIHFKKSLK